LASLLFQRMPNFWRFVYVSVYGHLA
jgi:hypothetical protein